MATSGIESRVDAERFRAAFRSLYRVHMQTIVMLD